MIPRLPPLPDNLRNTFIVCVPNAETKKRLIHELEAVYPDMNKGEIRAVLEKMICAAQTESSKQQPSVSTIDEAMPQENSIVENSIKVSGTSNRLVIEDVD
jgi:hypothetical protein